MLIDKQRGIYYGKEIFKLQRGGGNRLASHINSFDTILMRCLNAKTHRGKVCCDKSSLRANAKQSSKNCHPELDLGYINVDLNPSPAFQAPSPQVAREKIRIVEDMKENSFTDKVNSLFTTHHSLKRPAFTLAEGATHVAHWNNSRKIAFTLAEVLVTLGIIGVVSAMTVPTLMQNYQRQSYVTQLHKVYNELTQAAVQYQNDKNAVDLKEAGLTSQAAAEEFIESNFKIVQNCGTNKTPCFANTYRKIANSQNIGWNSNRTNYVLASGATLGVGYNPLSSDCLLELYVDTNGTKGPNIVGRDLWALFLYKDGSVDDFSGDPPTLTTAQRETAFTTYCTSDNANGWNGCFGKILNDNWQMTY